MTQGSATQTIDQRLAAAFAKTPSRELVKALLTLDEQPSSQENNWARAKTIDELERRFPTAAKAVEDAYYQDEILVEAGVDAAEVDYVAVLIAAIPPAAL